MLNSLAWMEAICEQVFPLTHRGRSPLATSPPPSLYSNHKLSPSPKFSHVIFFA